MICDCTTYAILRLRVHTRNTSDLADGLNPNITSIPGNITEHELEDAEYDDEDKVMNEDNENEDPIVTSKINALIMDMAKSYEGTGVTITMDNFYGGAIPLITLENMGIYAGCTYRIGRKHV